MHELTKLIFDDMKPALGVTEPGAIAFAVSTAREHIKGHVEKVILRLNSGMFKNAFTCGIPGISEVGNYHAAALGAVAADPKKGLECLDGISEEEKAEARKMVEDGRIKVEMTEVTSRIFIEATVEAGDETATVTIRDSHTNIVKIAANGAVVFEKEQAADSDHEEAALIHKYTLDEMHTYAKTVPIEEIAFVKDAYIMNWNLMQEGMESPKTTYARYLFAANGNKLVSRDEQKTASLFCNAAIEARVLGLSKPAMSITGSGAHGIIATMPLYAAYKVNGYEEEALYRATALSYLVCMYIKEYSGKLSAFCGCAIAAGTGMACGLVLLRGGSTADMEKTINNMACSITGMICDGGNQGCTMKGVVAVDAAFTSVNMAMQNVYIYNAHGINGATPEETMRNMGLIASPGMVGTEKTIVDILNMKNEKL
ncbi:MAG: serine dehydratase subunit alpha family protein [Lachnospiraceae bacterium]|nr:serine dehydratase subunit alpha family protein [Lachnospiraceae bacterium]